MSHFVGLAGLELTVANSQRDLPASGVLELKACMTGFLKITFQLFFFFGMGVLPAFMSLPLLCLVPGEARGDVIGIPWTWVAVSSCVNAQNPAPLRTAKIIKPALVCS